MAHKRVFFFGCSFTNYGWPTWADAVGHTLNGQGYEYYNFGLPGSGNDLIFKTMLRAKQEYNITSDDLIMVMWTSWNREDRYTRTEEGDNGVAWQLQGNVLNNDVYDDEFISKHWSLEHDIITSISAITAARQLFDICFEGSLPVLENALGDFDTDQLVSALSQLNMPCTIRDITSNKLIADLDGHPDIPKVLEYVDQVVSPVTGICLAESTRDWLSEFDKFMMDTTSALHHQKLSPSLRIRMWNDDISIKIRSHHHAQTKQYRMPESAASMWCSTKIIDYLNSFSNQA